MKIQTFNVKTTQFETISENSIIDLVIEDKIFELTEVEGKLHIRKRVSLGNDEIIITPKMSNVIDIE